MTGQQVITSTAAAMAELMLDTTRKRHGMEQWVYQKQKFISLHFKLLGIYWRGGSGEADTMQVISICCSFTQAQALVAVDQYQGFALTFHKFDITIET